MFSETILEVDLLFKSVIKPSNDKNRYAPNDIGAQLIPSNAKMLTVAKFSEDTPHLDIWGGCRPQIFDYGAYETLYVGP